MKKIALFGGTFNPPHFGHINLAIEVMEREAFDQVLWIPANVSPFRQNELQDASPEQRFEMVKLAISPIKEFAALDLEIRRSPPSYTIDTIDELVSDKNDYTLLLADDVYSSFSMWKEVERIREKVEILVVKRDQEGLKIPQMEISSTRIRERLKKGLYCGHLLPPIVLDYIYENQLYSTP